MFRYPFLPHRVPTICRWGAQTSVKAEVSSANPPLCWLSRHLTPYRKIKMPPLKLFIFWFIFRPTAWPICIKAPCIMCSDSALKHKLPITNLRGARKGTSGQQVSAACLCGARRQALGFARLASCFVRTIKDCSSLNRPRFGPMDSYFSVYFWACSLHRLYKRSLHDAQCGR